MEEDPESSVEEEADEKIPENLKCTTYLGLQFIMDRERSSVSVKHPLVSVIPILKESFPVSRANEHDCDNGQNR